MCVKSFAIHARDSHIRGVLLKFEYEPIKKLRKLRCNNYENRVINTPAARRVSRAPQSHWHSWRFSIVPLRNSRGYSDSRNGEGGGEVKWIPIRNRINFMRFAAITLNKKLISLRYFNSPPGIQQKFNNWPRRQFSSYYSRLFSSPPLQPWHNREIFQM